MTTETPENSTAEPEPPTVGVPPLATGSASVEREQKQWWAVHDDSVFRVTGYSCAPLNPDMWWCPQIGSSCSEKHHLFATEPEAIDKLLVQMERRLQETDEIITALRLRRQNKTDDPDARRS